MDAEQDLYAVLGVPRDATPEALRRAYRQLARAHHPDVNPNNPAAEERFKAVNAAYEVLSDPARRRTYDEFGREGLREGFNPEQARAYRRRPPPGGTYGPGGPIGADLGGGLGDLFAEFFSGSRRAAGRGQDIAAAVTLDFAQAIRGGPVQLEVPGHGAVTLRLPPGVDDGVQLRVAGRGHPGRGGAPPGDLLLRTSVRPHPYFRRAGLDLILRLPLTLEEAICGASVAVPTPQGMVQMRVPARAQAGSRLRLRGKGVQRQGQSGDLLVEVEICLPDADHPSLEALARASRQAYTRPIRQELKL